MVWNVSEVILLIIPGVLPSVAFMGLLPGEVRLNVSEEPTQAGT